MMSLPEKLTSYMVRYFVAVTGFVAVTAFVAIYTHGWADPPIRSDGYSYYVYLPATFIYHDPSLDALSRDWYGGGFPGSTAIRRWPATGRWLDACPIGVAALTLPFFVIADALSRWSNLPRDGFSFYYQYAAGLAGLAYFLAGLALIRQLLRPRFGDGVVLATLITLTWGTNLFHYGTFDATFSHAFSFFLVCAWLWLIERWETSPGYGRSAVMGVVSALIVLTRNVNGVFLGGLLLYGVSSVGDLRARIAMLWTRRQRLLVAAAGGAVCLAPQLLLYKSITGRWFVNSYSLLNDRFTFGSPHVIAVLFSPQKGLFFWSPALALAVLGAFVARGWPRRFLVSAIVVFVLQTYVVASWNDWQLGGSYGHRAFTDGFGLVAPLIAAAFQWAATRRRAIPIAIFTCAAVSLSVAQMAQYWLGVLPFANTTWEQYRSLFLRFP